MIMRPLSVLLLAAAAPAMMSAERPFVGGGADTAWRDGVQWAQLTIRERVIVRIPRIAAPPRPTPPTASRWIERKAPRCVAVQSLTGAVVRRDGVVELTTDEGGRLRATLGDDCPTLDFYSGFYLKPTGDGMLCAKRDVLRSRSGAHCMVTGFRKLVARH